MLGHKASGKSVQPRCKPRQAGCSHLCNFPDSIVPSPWKSKSRWLGRRSTATSPPSRKHLIHLLTIVSRDKQPRAIYRGFMDTRTARATKAGTREALKLNAQLCFALYSTLLGVNRVYRKLLRDLDITYPQYLVMLVLWEQDEVNVSGICEQLYLETPTLTPLLKRLETRRLLRRKRSASDERQVIVTLTAAGRAMRDQARSIPSGVGRAMACSSDEIAGLRDRLVALRTQLFRYS